MEAPLDAEVGGEGEREDSGVGRHVAARVVADQQHRALGGDVLEPAHVGAEVDAGEHPEAGQVLADVVGVALVEVGRRDAPAPARSLVAAPSRAATSGEIGDGCPRRCCARALARSAIVAQRLASLRPVSEQAATWTAVPAGGSDLRRSPAAGRSGAPPPPGSRSCSPTVSIAVLDHVVAALRGSSGSGP